MYKVSKTLTNKEVKEGKGMNICKFDMALKIVSNPKYKEGLTIGQLRNLDVDKLKELYEKYKNER